MKSGNEKRPDTRWWQMLVLAGVTMLLVGCSDYRLLANLKDNPMDQAIATGAPGSDLEETRERLLKRFPVGQAKDDLPTSLACRQKIVNQRTFIQGEYDLNVLPSQIIRQVFWCASNDRIEKTDILIFE